MMIDRCEEKERRLSAVICFLIVDCAYEPCVLRRPA